MKAHNSVNFPIVKSAGLLQVVPLMRAEESTTMAECSQRIGRRAQLIGSVESFGGWLLTYIAGSLSNFDVSYFIEHLGQFHSVNI